MEPSPFQLQVSDCAGVLSFWEAIKAAMYPRIELSRREMKRKKWWGNAHQREGGEREGRDIISYGWRRRLVEFATSQRIKACYLHHPNYRIWITTYMNKINTVLKKTSYGLNWKIEMLAAGPFWLCVTLSPKRKVVSMESALAHVVRRSIEIVVGYNLN